MIKVNKYIGIDPGMSKTAPGAIAVISDDSDYEPRVFDFPGDIASLGDLFVREIIFDIKGCAIESIHASPTFGKVTCFNLGCNYGAYLGILSVLQIPHVLISPNKWQKEILDSGTGQTKERSLNMARRLFPDIDLRLKKHHGRADALHLARYAKKYFNNE